MKSRTLKWSLLSGAGLLAAMVVLGFLWFRHLGKAHPERHRHCIKAAGIAFSAYSEDHAGALPFHTNGFGDALLLLVKEKYLPCVAWICGPGDDGTVLSNALVHGLDVPEELCSRVYVQGLSRTNSAGICILFDRRSVPGGDHGYGKGQPIREVWMDGMYSISDEKWPEFSREQVERLVAVGWTREKALGYYPEATMDQPGTYGLVTNAINAEDWDALRRLVKPGMRANEYITKWENSGRAGQTVRVGRLRNVKMDSTYNLDGKPCAEYSFALENKDGTLNPHWLQILVREENGRSEILDFWEFGW